MPIVTLGIVIVTLSIIIVTLGMFEVKKINNAYVSYNIRYIRLYFI